MHLMNARISKVNSNHTEARYARKPFHSKHSSKPNMYFVTNDYETVLSIGHTLCMAWAYITYMPREVSLA